MTQRTTETKYVVTWGYSGFSNAFSTEEAARDCYAREADVPSYVDRRKCQPVELTKVTTTITTLEATR